MKKNKKTKKSYADEIIGVVVTILFAGIGYYGYSHRNVYLIIAIVSFAIILGAMVFAIADAIVDKKRKEKEKRIKEKREKSML